MTKKFKSCVNCLYREDTTWSYENAICQKCVQENPDDILPPSEWKYEDPEGESK